MRYYSLRINLEEVILDKDKEQVILENIRRCSKVAGKFFKVIFYYKNLTEKQCKDFDRRNEKLLFEVNTKITKGFNPAWFIINSIGEKSQSRYRYEGDILGGIVKYLEITNHIKKRDKE